LEDYTEAKEQASKVKGIGIDPKMAHDTEEALTTLKMQVSQLGMTAASALIPVVSQIIPPLLAGMSQVAAFIKSHSAEITATLTVVGATIKDILTAVIPIFTSALTFIAEHGTLIKNILIGIGIAFGSFKTVTTIIGEIVKAQELWEKATKAVEIAQEALNVVMEMNPVGLIIAAVAALVAILIYLWNTNEGFRNALIGAWKAIQQFFIDLWDWLKGFFSQWGTVILPVIFPFIGIPLLIIQHWNDIKAGLEDAWNFIKNTAMAVFNSITNFFTGVWSAISNTFSSYINGIVKFVGTNFSGMLNGIQQIFNGIKTFFSGIWELIKNIFLGAVLLLIDLVTGNFTKLQQDSAHIFKNLSDALAQIWDGIKEIFTGAINAVTGFMKSAFTLAVSAAVTVWTSLRSFFVNMWDNIKNAAFQAWNVMKDSVINLCTDIKNGAVNVWNGLLAFFQNLPSTLYNTAVNMFTAMKNGVVNTITEGYNAVVNGINGAVDFIQSLPKKMFEWGADMITGLINGIKSMVDNIGGAVNGVADKIRAIPHFSAPDEGPLADYEKWMPDFMAGLAKGIQNSRQLVTNAVSGMGADLKVQTTATLQGGLQNGMTAQAQNMGQTGGLVLNIQNFYNNTDKDIENLAYELDFYQRKLSMGRNGA
jgi:phage-related protein